MKPITLTDLDGVHFQTRRDCPINVDLTAGALNADGIPSSYMTPSQSSFLELLLANSLVVPVTARPVESFKRVLVSFSGYAICSFGGVILTPEGLLEPTWHEQILAESRLYGPRLYELKEAIVNGCAQQGTAVSATVVGDAGCDLYLNCKLADQTKGSIADVRVLMQSLLPDRWQMHSNGNNVAALPPFLSKERAANYYLTELAPPHSCVLGIGDSHTDLGFMGLCDYAIAPTNSQIFSLFNQPEKKTEPA